MVLVEVPWLHPAQMAVVVDGQVYDLKEFINKHPGGGSFLIFSKGKDITISTYTYHKSLAKVQSVLKKYLVGPADPHQLPEKYVNKAYLASNKEYAQPLVPDFDFTLPDQFQHQVINAIKKDTTLQAKLKSEDDQQDMVMYATLACYVVIMSSLCFNLINPWLCALAMIVVRNALCSFGHFALHTNGPIWETSMADMGYYLPGFGARFFHAMMHHSLGDHEDEHHRFECTSCLGLPRLWRLPVISFGHIFQWFVTSNKKLLMKGQMIMSKPVGRQVLGPFLFFSSLARGVMTLEFIICLMTGQIAPWILQACGTRFLFWLSVVGSHDFCGGNQVSDPDMDCKDWGLFQIRHANNFYITGIPKVDSLLSAGHSVHIVHHLLPFQKSGFAHMATEPLVLKMAKERGAKVNPPQSLVFETAPSFLKYIFTKTEAKNAELDFFSENFSWHSVQAIGSYIYNLP